MARSYRRSFSTFAALYGSIWLVLVCSSTARNSFARTPARPKLVMGECIGKWKVTHATGNLAELPRETHGPDSLQWTNSVAICALMKSENSTDVREWLLYYRWLGIQHVYLTENARRPTPHMRGQLHDFITDGFLTYEVDGTRGPQLKVYHRCMTEHYHKHNWIAYLDLDEILVLRERPQQTLPEFLDRYKHHAGLSVHWVLVGPSGQHERPPSGGMMRHYTQCAGEATHVLKTIVNTYFLSNNAGHAHNFEFRDGMRSVDENFEEISPRGVYACSSVPPAVSNLTQVPVPYESGAHFYQDAGASSPRRVVNKVALFHYSTKSQADFAVKIARGASSGGNPKSWKFFEQLSMKAHYTGGLCGLPQSLADLCCSPDKLVLEEP